MSRFLVSKQRDPLRSLAARTTTDSPLTAAVARLAPDGSTPERLRELAGSGGTLVVDVRPGRDDVRRTVTEAI